MKTNKLICVELQAAIVCSSCISNAKLSVNTKIKIDHSLDTDSHIESADECTHCSTLRRRQCEKCRNINKIGGNVSPEGNNSSSSPCRNCTANKEQVLNFLKLVRTKKYFKVRYLFLMIVYYMAKILNH